MIMRFLILTLLMATVTTGDMLYFLGENDRRNLEKDEWWITESRISRLPDWDPERRDPPVSPRAAVRIAEKWLKKRDKSGGAAVASIEIRPFRRDLMKWPFKFYYWIRLEPRQFDHAVCVVLMDGTVLEPKVLRNPE
jgi:hypothetical protein